MESPTGFSIPRQSAPQTEATEHWLVRRLHDERRAADDARRAELLARSASLWQPVSVQGSSRA